VARAYNWDNSPSAFVPEKAKTAEIGGIFCAAGPLGGTEIVKLFVT
jgi:hypothetical protein